MRFDERRAVCLPSNQTCHNENRSGYLYIARSNITKFAFKYISISRLSCYMGLTILLARPIRAILSAKIMSAQKEGTCRMNKKRFCGDAEGCLGIKAKNG